MVDGCPDNFWGTQAGHQGVGMESKEIYREMQGFSSYLENLCCYNLAMKQEDLRWSSVIWSFTEIEHVS